MKSRRSLNCSGDNYWDVCVLHISSKQ